MPVISVEGIGVHFKLRKEKRRTLKEAILKPFSTREVETFWALKDVSFKVEKGEIVGIVGKNGSGKTTLFLVLSRILLPDEGRISINGQTTTLLTIGAGFRPDLTGRDNIYLNGAFLGLSEEEIDERFESIAEFSELGKFINIPVKNYSSGMTARLGFSIAQSVEPDILLIDEVFGVGDIAFRQKCQERMKVLMGKAKAICIITHNMEQVNEFCTRAFWLHEGRIKEEGRPRDVTEKYREWMLSPSREG